jgi:menaquinone-9 beta-reductase
MQRLRYDAVIVGAGSAGAAAAWQLARRGLRVALLDRRRREATGARWRNAIPRWMFYDSGIPAPTPPELRGGHEPIHLLPADDRTRCRIPMGPWWQVDMGRLVARLQGMAEAEGVQLLDEIELDEVVLDGRRPVALRLHRRDERFRLRGSLFVDASGMAGALRDRVPELSRHTPPIPLGHTCVAIQEVREVRDPGAAAAFQRRAGAPPGVVLTWIGVTSGFSTFAVGLSPDLSEVDLLAGAAGSRDDAPRMLADFRSREPWVGDLLIGGGGPIPLRRPYDRLGAPGVALIGDAACQVYSAHGSGVGMGLLAGRQLAEVVCSFDDPGAEDATWAYQARFMRKHGGLLGATDLFRRASQALGPDQVGALFATGLIEPTSSLQGLEQRFPTPNARSVLAAARGLVRAPRLTLSFSATLRKMSLARGIYARYPRRPDMEALGRWSAEVGRLMDEPADLEDRR